MGMSDFAWLLCFSMVDIFFYDWWCQYTLS
jgi:hypothetical protein